jgi:hypothetical protein
MTLSFLFYELTAPAASIYVGCYAKVQHNNLFAEFVTAGDEPHIIFY